MQLFEMEYDTDRFLVPIMDSYTLLGVTKNVPDGHYWTELSGLILKFSRNDREGIHGLFCLEFLRESARRRKGIPFIPKVPSQPLVTGSSGTVRDTTPYEQYTCDEQVRRLAVTPIFTGFVNRVELLYVSTDNRDLFMEDLVKSGLGDMAFNPVDLLAQSPVLVVTEDF